MIQLGPFRLIRPLAEGGMGRVWLAEHPAQRLPLAVKVLTAEGARDPRVRAALANEIRAVASLEHPHIIWLYDQGVVEERSGGLVPGSPWLAMELARRGTLADRVGQTDWAGLRAVLLEVLEALAHAHSRGVIHRDLKPQNVLVREGRELVLTDFGIAHAVDASRDLASGAGTPLYMAPEQIRRSAADQGPWTDLYALGCMGWELATGAPPFVSGDLRTLAQAQLHEQPGRFTPRFGVASSFEEWLRRLLEKAPEDRFPLAADAAWILRSMPSFVEVLRPTDAQPLRRDESTWMPSTSALTHIELPAETTPAPEPRHAPAPQDRPPLPSSWRLPSDAYPRARLLDAGQALFAIRAHPLVGRTDERDALWAALREVHGKGEPRVVLLTGPAGCGKSALARWLCERAEEVGGARSLRTRCTPEGEDGLAGLMRRALGLAGTMNAALADRISRREVPQGWLQPDEVDDLVRFLAEPDAHSPARRATWAARLLAHLARQLPVVVWLDDAIHSADALTLARNALRPGADLGPVLFAVTARDDARAANPENDRTLGVIAKQESCSSVVVGPLDQVHWRALVDALLPFSGGTRDSVAERVEGNPLHAVQLVNDWVQRGVLEIREDGWALADAERDRPLSIAAVWERRLESVLGDSPDALLALELAATLGTGPSWREWRAAVEHAGLPFEDGLVERLAGGGLASDHGERWTFAHAMLREALLRRAAGGGRLRAHHRTCATVIRPAGPADEERVALHLTEAEAWEEAEPQLRTAVHTRFRGGDPGRVLQLVRHWRTLAAALSLSDDDPRRGEIDRLWVHGAINHFRLSEAEPVIRASLARAERLGWTKEQAIAWMQLATVLRLGRRHDEARVAIHRGRELAEQIGSPDHIGNFWHAEGWIHLELGQHADAQACFAEAVRFKEASDEPSGLAASLVGLSVSLIKEERFVEALDCAERSAGVAHNHLPARLDALVCAGNARQQLGDLAGAERDFAEALSIARRLGNLVDRMTAELNQGLLLVRLGRTSQARAMLASVRAAAELQRVPQYVTSAWAGLLACAAEDPDPTDWDIALAGLRSHEGVPDGELAGLLTWLGGRVEDPTRAHQVLELARGWWLALDRADRVAEVDALRAETPC